MPSRGFRYSSRLGPWWDTSWNWHEIPPPPTPEEKAASLAKAAARRELQGPKHRADKLLRKF